MHRSLKMSWICAFCALKRLLWLWCNNAMLCMLDKPLCIHHVHYINKQRKIINCIQSDSGVNYCMLESSPKLTTWEWHTADRFKDSRSFYLTMNLVRHAVAIRFTSFPLTMPGSAINCQCICNGSHSHDSFILRSHKVDSRERSQTNGKSTPMSPLPIRKMVCVTFFLLIQYRDYTFCPRPTP